jgi:hypothetical protein
LSPVAIIVSVQLGCLVFVADVSVVYGYTPQLLAGFIGRAPEAHLREILLIKGLAVIGV